MPSPIAGLPELLAVHSMKRVDPAVMMSWLRVLVRR
jgi:hypothetical protein